MVEPLEETRSELTFATEPLNSTLQQAIPTSSSPSRNLDAAELDEIEVNKNFTHVLIYDIYLITAHRYKRECYNFLKD